MFSNGSNYSLSDIAAVTNANGSCNGGNSWGGDGYGWIWILLIFAIFGWGGFGNGYGGFGGNGGVNNPGFQGYATRADINEGFALNNITSGITAIQQGICDATYALDNTINNGFNNMNTAMLQGFNGANTTMLQGFNNSNVAMMQGFNSIDKGFCATQNQISQCCCDLTNQIGTQFANLNYNLAQQSCDTRQTINSATRDMIENSNANTRAILDFLTTDKISALQAENAALVNQISQANQTNNIISQLRTPTPVPAYLTCSPYQAQMMYAPVCGQACGC